MNNDKQTPEHLNDVENALPKESSAASETRDPLAELAKLIGLDDEIVPPPQSFDRVHRVEPVFAVNQTQSEPFSAAQVSETFVSQSPPAQSPLVELESHLVQDAFVSEESPFAPVKSPSDDHSFHDDHDVGIDQSALFAEMDRELSGVIENLVPPVAVPAAAESRVQLSPSHEDEILQPLPAFLQAHRAVSTPSVTSSTSETQSLFSQPETNHLFQVEPVADVVETDKEAPFFSFGQSPIETSQERFLTESSPLASQFKPKAKNILVVAVVMGVAAVGALTAFLFRGATQVVSSNGLPVIVSDKTPVKVSPENPGGSEIPNLNKQVYERSKEEAPSKVVSREEQPVDMSRLPRVILANPTAPGGANPIPSEVPPPKTSTDAKPLVEEPKKVKTVTLRADGTPVEETSKKIVVAQPVPKPDTKTTDTKDTSKQQARLETPVQRPVTAPTPVVTKPEAASSTAINAPLSLAPKRTADTALQKSSETAPASVTRSEVIPSGSAMVQLSSLRSEQEARTTFANLAKKHGALSGLTPKIVPVTLGDKGTFYRLQVGPFDAQRANSVCNNIKSGGGSCLIQR